MSSWGTVGTDAMGASAGMGGYAAWSPMGRFETSGWPVSRTQLSGPGFTYDATTDYYGDGRVRHRSTLDSDIASFDNHFSLGPDGYKQNADVRVGSTQIVCKNHVCMMAP